MSDWNQLEKHTWTEVRDQVRSVNPTLANIIDQFNPGPEYTLLRMKYPFGSQILKDGSLQIPTESGSTISLNHVNIPKVLQKQLGYCSVPMALILSKSVEAFFETENRVMPSKLFCEGALFGLWEALDPPPPDFIKKVWNLTAGSRSLFLLPKIADTIAHGRLRKEYGLSEYPPKRLLDHHKVFSDIVRHSNDSRKWQAEILFFSNEWIKECNNDIGWLKLHNFWLAEAWKQSLNCRNKMSYDMAWEAFAKAVSQRNLKPNPYIINTIKHLIAIGEGIFPGFRPACDSEMAAPVNTIQDAYINTYLLKQQAPILMYPDHLYDPNIPVYYSLSLPTLLEFALKPSNTSSIMADIRELKLLMNILQNAIEDIPVAYEFFHSDTDQFGEIRHASEMPKDDANLIDYPKQYGQRTFPANSPFLKGCIRIALKRGVSPRVVFQDALGLKVSREK